MASAETAFAPRLCRKPAPACAASSNSLSSLPVGLVRRWYLRPPCPEVECPAEAGSASYPATGCRRRGRRHPPLGWFAIFPSVALAESAWEVERTILVWRALRLPPSLNGARYRRPVPCSAFSVRAVESQFVVRTPCQIAKAQHAKDLGVSRVFCLTFEVGFFKKHGFEVIRADQSGRGP